jgi:uncharacterized protein
VAFYYADTSVLVKRHDVEVGSAWVVGITDPAALNLIITARIAIVEIFSALNRKIREGQLALATYTRIAPDVQAVCATQYRLIEVTADIVDHARNLVEPYPLKGYDAVHLAAALHANDALQAAGLPPLTFLTADDKLLRAAQAEGLAVDDPRKYP